MHAQMVTVNAPLMTSPFVFLGPLHGPEGCAIFFYMFLSLFYYCLFKDVKILL